MASILVTAFYFEAQLREITEANRQQDSRDLIELQQNALHEATAQWAADRRLLQKQIDDLEDEVDRVTKDNIELRAALGLPLSVKRDEQSACDSE